MRSDLRSILRGNVLILFLTWLLLSFGNNMVHKFDGVYFKALGASDVMLGYMGAITFGMMALLQIPGGHIADAFGRKRVVVVFTFVMAFSMLIFAFAPSWEYIVIGLIVTNLALLYQPGLFSIVMDSLPPDRRAEGFAITNLSSLPALAAPLVGGALIYYYGVVPGMRLSYLILFFLSLAAAFMRVFLKETSTPRGKGERPSPLSFFGVIRTADVRARGMIAVAMLFTSATGMVGYFLVIYASSYTNEVVFGIAMAISMLFSVVFGVVAGRLGDARGKEKFYISGSLLVSLGLAVFVVPSVLALFSYAAIFGLGMALYQPSSNGLMADLVPLEIRGRFTGVYLFLSYLSTMVSSIIAGYIFRYSPTLLFTIASAMSLLAAMIALRVFLLSPES